MLKDGMTVWIIDEYDDVEEATITEKPKGSGEFYYYNGITDEYEYASDVFLTKEEAEKALVAYTNDFIEQTENKESLLQLLFEGWRASTERTNGDWDREKIEVVEKAIQKQFNVILD